MNVAQGATASGLKKESAVASGLERENDGVAQCPFWWRGYLFPERDPTSINGVVTRGCG